MHLISIEEATKSFPSLMQQVKSSYLASRCGHTDSTKDRIGWNNI
jgi:hypothetical protein